MRYIAVDDVDVTETLDIPAMNTKVDEEALGPEGVVNDGGAYIHQTAVRQLLRECDPKFDLSKEEFCRHTRSVTDASDKEQHTGPGKLDLDPF